MRLWTVHPKYLDSKGLVALWREGLLAKAVLEGKTRGYRNHSQLVRFREEETPSIYLSEYLHGVLEESLVRGYKFDGSKLSQERHDLPPMTESTGQLEYEWSHLLNKLQVRDPGLYKNHLAVTKPDPHPIFRIAKGKVKPWEKVG
ncbi:MAG: hypothetical protein ACI8UO_004065 [Verrucomicrobiales bacterium]|jgi:hypothetical protein